MVRAGVLFEELISGTESPDHDFDDDSNDSESTGEDEDFENTGEDEDVVSEGTCEEGRRSTIEVHPNFF